MAVARAIRLSFEAIEQAEGVGARVRRSIGTPKLRNFSPFLMLDHFTIYPGAGFPDHPHRGQETITYLLSGAVDHEDFAGNKGTIWAGDLQFMTAGKGIMHAEMPRDMGDGSPDVGMQLWVDLPKHLKSVEPRYRDLRAKEIPQVVRHSEEKEDTTIKAAANNNNNSDNDESTRDTETDSTGGVLVKIISGKSHGVDSVRDLAYTPVWILDITIQPGGKIRQQVPKDWNAFAYTLSGTVSFTDGDDRKDPNRPNNVKTILPYHNVVFENDGLADVVIAQVDSHSDQPARFILFAGQPLDQQVIQYGPFVLNSREGVMQAMTDFQSNANGFERAKGWSSQIGKAMTAG